MFTISHISLLTSSPSLPSLVLIVTHSYFTSLCSEAGTGFDLHSRCFVRVRCSPSHTFRFAPLRLPLASLYPIVALILGVSWFSCAFGTEFSLPRPISVGTQTFLVIRFEG
ncbi:hypothetical protein K438DRAFT_846026 [Mycena galopus ATCC 62051]|nr:hypothetical protein K438DRAFT_846026 [Mycena galopus ATCC 62051]